MLIFLFVPLLLFHKAKNFAMLTAYSENRFCYSIHPYFSILSIGVIWGKKIWKVCCKYCVNIPCVLSIWDIPCGRLLYISLYRCLSPPVRPYQPPPLRFLSFIFLCWYGNLLRASCISIVLNELWIGHSSSRIQWNPRKFLSIFSVFSGFTSEAQII